jgi:hypothetical protein
MDCEFGFWDSESGETGAVVFGVRFKVARWDQL